MGAVLTPINADNFVFDINNINLMKYVYYLAKNIIVKHVQLKIINQRFQ